MLCRCGLLLLFNSSAYRKPLFKIPWTPVYPCGDNVWFPYLQRNLALIFCDFGHSIFFSKEQKKRNSRVLENATGTFDLSVHRYFRSTICYNWQLEGDRAIEINKCSEMLAMRSVYIFVLLLLPCVCHVVPFKACWSSEKNTTFHVVVIFCLYIFIFTDIGIW